VTMRAYVSIAVLIAVSGALAAASGSAGGGATAAALRVCADPNNLPFSHRNLEGFENRIAALLASDLRTSVRYTWWAQRRGFLRNTLNARACDVVMGLPSSVQGAGTTRPYYRSTYVFVSRRDRHLRLASLDDEVLGGLRIGVPLVVDDGGGSPPAIALSRRGLATNLVGFSVYGDYTRESPPADLIAAVAAGRVDLAIAWGPLAGYFASRQRIPLDVIPIAPPRDRTLPFAFDISMAVRRDDEDLKRTLDDFVARRQAEIDAILDAYNVPRLRRAEGV
jgi:mxaJ protein